MPGEVKIRLKLREASPGYRNPDLPGTAPSLNAPGFGMIVRSGSELTDEIRDRTNRDVWAGLRKYKSFPMINIAPPPGSTSAGGGGGSSGDPIWDGLMNGNLTLTNGQINYTSIGGMTAEVEQKWIRQQHRDQKVINAGNPEQAQANEAARIESGWANRQEQSAYDWERNWRKNEPAWLRWARGAGYVLIGIGLAGLGIIGLAAAFGSTWAAGIIARSPLINYVMGRILGKVLGDHAIGKMIERGITRSLIENVIKQGKTYYDLRTGRLVYFMEEQMRRHGVAVVTKNYNREIVTVLIRQFSRISPAWSIIVY